MLDKKVILKDVLHVKNELLKKGFNFDDKLFLTMEAERKELQKTLEECQARKNQIANEIKKMFINKADMADIETLKEEGTAVGNNIAKNKTLFECLNSKLNNFLLTLPNLPDINCPVGDDEEANVLVKEYLKPTDFDFEPKDHVELTNALNGNTLDFEKGVQLAKSRFVVMKDKTAKLHRAIGQFMLDVHTENHGYMEVNIPVIANKKTLTGTGQLPKFEEDLFKIEGTEMALIPTAEVPLTNLFANEKLKLKELPIKLTALSLCFREEVGSAGRDVKGILRQHQFEKVELVQIVEPEKSEEALFEILKHAETILQMLKIPYKVVELCTGDLGFSAQKTFDIEVWVPSQNTYREISSCSNMGDFQARRMNVKLKDNGRKELLHTLNGSGLAVGRTLLAVLENYQLADGTIKIPEVLIPYMNGCQTL